MHAHIVRLYAYSILYAYLISLWMHAFPLHAAGVPSHVLKPSWVPLLTPLYTTPLGSSLN